jgi:hypothetical protein
MTATPAVAPSSFEDATFRFFLCAMPTVTVLKAQASGPRPATPVPA